MRFSRILLLTALLLASLLSSIESFPSTTRTTRLGAPGISATLSPRRAEAVRRQIGRDATGIVSKRATESLLQVIILSLKSAIMSIQTTFLSMTTAQKILTVAVFVSGYLVGRVPPFWERYTAVSDIPSRFFGAEAPILKGRAVSVADGDTIRFYHVPTMFHRKKLRKGQKLSEVAIPVRICTIDAPETAKFGKAGQVG